MRSRLFWKLLGVQLLAFGLLLTGALAVMRWNTAHNFSAYLDATRRGNLKTDADRIAHAYERLHDLTEAANTLPRISGDPPRTRERFRDDGPDRPPPEGPSAPPGQPDEGTPGPPPVEPPNEPPRPPAEARPNRGPLPLQVQAPDHRIVAGSRRPIPEDDIWREPIVVNGETIGYLAQPVLGFRPAIAEEVFLHAQTRGLWLIGGVSLVLAALVAAIVATLVLNPLRRLSTAAAALADRRFDTQLPVDRNDEIGQLAEDFNRLATSLAGYDQRQKQWIADIAHELRTPLAVLRGELEAVMDGVRKAEPATVRSLHQEVQRLTKLVDDLHLLSLAESGGLRIRPVRVDLGSLVDESHERFRERFQQRGFRLEKSAGDPSLLVDADRQRIEQVIGNLLENTLRHADPPGPVQLSAGRSPAGVFIRVSDAGPGVPADALPRLFDRLYRVDASRSRASGGAGLGLAISRSIAEAHGGTLVARASARGGLEVELVLPAPRGLPS